MRKGSLQWAAVLALLMAVLCMPAACVLAEAGEHRFPAGTIEVPQGTEFLIDEDNGVITIMDSPAQIGSGDTFVIYLQDLPIGYVAQSVSVQGDRTVIRAQKAGKELYAGLEESGVIELTADMYEFIPASDDIRLQPDAAKDGGLNWAESRLVVEVPTTGGLVSVSLYNLSLTHSISGGDVTVALNGRWEFSAGLKGTQAILDDLKLGELRVAGIGKIELRLSMKQSMELNCRFVGTFSAGIIARSDGSSEGVKEFGVIDRMIEGKGTISAGLKLVAGVDVLVANADIYAEVGIETQYTSQYHSDENTGELTHCDDFKIYLFTTIGAEAKSFNILTRKMEPYAAARMKLINGNNSPVIVKVHFEDGKLMSRCSFGMVVPDLEFGGLSGDFGSTLFTDERDRILETDVKLPWDMEVDEDYHIANGNLNLDGHTLTINGDLIQSGGTLTISNGTLIVHGDYRIQTPVAGMYTDSIGTLRMNHADGQIQLDGDFILQTTSASHSLTAGRFAIDGDIRQINPSAGVSKFNSGSGCEIVMTAGRRHTISFEDAQNNSIGCLVMEDDVTSEGDVSIGRADMNGYRLVVNGTFFSADSVDLQDFAPGNEVFTPEGDITLEGDMTVESSGIRDGMNMNGYSLTVNGDMISTSDIDLNNGTLTVLGTLYQRDGLMKINGGKLYITGSYYIAGAGSNFESGTLEATKARLSMGSEQDEIRIVGNFAIASTYGNSPSAGTMYIGGDFRQVGSGSVLGTYTYHENFKATNDHRVVFNGTGRQSIQFDSASSGFANVEFANPDIELKGSALRGFTLEDDINLTLGTDKLSLEGTMDLNGHSIGEGVYDGDLTLDGRGTLIPRGSDLTINGDLNLSSALNLSGQTLTVNGDMTVSGGLSPNGDIDLNNGLLNVAGTLHQTYGTVSINGGRLHVGGSCYFVGANSNIGAGSYHAVNGRLMMSTEQDEIRVGGDFVIATTYASSLSAGTIRIGGNFRQVGTYSGYSSSYANAENFNSKGTHRVVFDGDGRQSIQFASTGSGFNAVEFLNRDIELKGSALRGFTLEDDIHLTLDTDKLSLEGTMDLNGHSIGEGVYDGDLTLEGRGTLILSGSDLTINGSLNMGCAMDLGGQTLMVGGGMTVSGDMTPSGDMDLNNGTLIVAGTLYKQKGKLTVNGGRLHIGENFYFVGASSNTEAGTFKAADGRLTMNTEQDEIRIGGDFIIASTYAGTLSAGTMYIGGNFRQVGTYSSYSSSYANAANFKATGTHKVVLCGEEPQNAQFESSSSTFNILQIEKPLRHYVFSRIPCWNILLEPELEPIVLPSALTAIEDEMFMNNTGLLAMRIPEGNLTAIGAGAFRGCTQLQRVEIPGSVTFIAEDAFDGCAYLVIVCEEGSYAQAYADAHGIPWKPMEAKTE